MKYKVMLVKNTGETVDESAELLSAENAISLIKAWESTVGRPTPLAPDAAKWNGHYETCPARNGETCTCGY